MQYKPFLLTLVHDGNLSAYLASYKDPRVHPKFYTMMLSLRDPHEAMYWVTRPMLRGLVVNIVLLSCYDRVMLPTSIF